MTHRVRFLFVAGFLGAAAACTAKATSNPQGDGGASNGDAGVDHDAGVAGGDGGRDAAPVGDGGLLPGWDGGCLGTAGGDTTTCAVYGTVVPEGGTGEDADVPPCITLDLCESVSAVNAGVAAQILACEKSDLTSGCTRTTPCVLAALAVACPSSSAASTCAPVVSACADAGVSVDGGAGAISEANCEQLIAGFNSTTLQTLTSCLSTSCNVQACISSLF